jgi:hypothetical protein
MRGKFRAITKNFEILPNSFGETNLVDLKLISFSHFH